MAALVEVLRNLVSARIDVLRRIIDILSLLRIVAFRLITDADHVVCARVAARIGLWGLLLPELRLDCHVGWAICSQIVHSHNLLLLISRKPRRGDSVRDWHTEVRERVSIIDDIDRLPKTVTSHSELIAIRH